MTKFQISQRDKVFCAKKLQPSATNFQPSMERFQEWTTDCYSRSQNLIKVPEKALAEPLHNLKNFPLLKDQSEFLLKLLGKWNWKISLFHVCPLASTKSRLFQAMKLNDLLWPLMSDSLLASRKERHDGSRRRLQRSHLSVRRLSVHLQQRRKPSVSHRLNRRRRLLLEAKDQLQSAQMTIESSSSRTSIDHQILQGTNNFQVLQLRETSFILLQNYQSTKVLVEEIVMFENQFILLNRSTKKEFFFKCQ